MLYSIRNREDLEILDKLASLNNQVDQLRLQDKLGEQIFREILKKIFEPLTDTIEDISRDI